MLRPLVLHLKGLLRRYDLCHAYTGGLSSYATVLLVTYFLDHFRAPDNLGQGWLALLHFIAHAFDPAKEVLEDG